MANAVVLKNEEYSLGLEATELRLGLPGDAEAAKSSHGKRGFSETIDLKLKLQMGGIDEIAMADEENNKSSGHKSTEKPPSKAQVVGWPPVRSYRKNIMAIHSEKAAKDNGEKSGNATTTTAATFVKVSMDGAPYLRKVDLKTYNNYRELSIALENMFSSFNIGSCGSQGMNGRGLMNESKLMDLLNGSEYVPTYEDKDGDWMLVGDVPWEMFVDSCKRLRIMKGSEAIGLAPRAMEKCKNRS